MITISVKEIKKFIAKSGTIPDSNALPIYSYVKLVCGKDRSYFVKHAGHKFLIYDVDAESKKEMSVMLESKPFFGFAKFSRGEEITISTEGKNIKLDDGDRTITFQSTKDLLPTILDHSAAEKFEVTSDVTEALGIAKNHVFPAGDELRPWNAYVHIFPIHGVNYVIGTRGEITYFKGFKQPLPTVSFEPETISAIRDLKEFSYYSVGNYDYFESLGTLYGFAKPETKCSPQCETVLDRFNSENVFTVARQPLVDFCEMVIATNSTHVEPQIRIEGPDSDKITIRFKDISDNLHAFEEIPVENKTFSFEELLFRPKNVLITLKDIKSEKVKICYAYHNFVFTNEEENYIGAMMEQQLPVNA